MSTELNLEDQAIVALWRIGRAIDLHSRERMQQAGLPAGDARATSEDVSQFLDKTEKQTDQPIASYQHEGRNAQCKN